MIDQTLEKLADMSQTPTHKLLRSLSGLERADLTSLQQAWPNIDVRRRRQIMRALVEMSEDDSHMDFEDVFRIAMTDTDEEARSTAVSGMWESTDERLVDPLIAILQHDASAMVRSSAAEVLGHFSSMAADGRLHGGRDKRLLAALLDAFAASSDPANTTDVRRNVLESMAAWGEDERVQTAIRQAYADPELAMRAGAVSAMGFTFDQTWEPIVLAELDSEEAEMRFEAARAAGDLWLENAVPRLVALTRDEDVEVRLMAIGALGEIGGAQAKVTLVQLLESHDAEVRDAAEEALEDLRFDENALSFDDLLGPAKGKKPKS
jgi:HEAT repeat protein